MVQTMYGTGRQLRYWLSPMLQDITYGTGIHLIYRSSPMLQVITHDTGHRL